MKDLKGNVVDINNPHLSAPKWLNDPGSFDKEEFMREMENSHRRLYKNTCDIDRYLLGIMADAMERYIICNKAIMEQGYVIEYNDGKTPGINPNFNAMYKSMDTVLDLMKEFGLTPKERLKNGVREPTEDDIRFSKLLKGPEFFKD